MVLVVSDVINIALGSVLFGFFGFGLVGLGLLAMVKRRYDWSARSLKYAFSAGLIGWGIYQFIIFMRFFLEYVIGALPVWQAFTLSFTSRLTENPFMFGINPFGYLWISPVQALMTWALEVVSAGVFIYGFGPMILRE